MTTDLLRDDYGVQELEAPSAEELTVCTGTNAAAPLRAFLVAFGLFFNAYPIAHG